MYQQSKRPPLQNRKDSFVSGASNNSSLYSLGGMEQPVPSFKSFVRAVAPVPGQERSAPPKPAGRRSSSVYNTIYQPWGPRESRASWARKRSSIAEFYLQALSNSNPNLHTSRYGISGFESGGHPPLPTQDFYFTPRKASKHVPPPPLLLEPRTYTPAPTLNKKSHSKKSSSTRSSLQKPTKENASLPETFTPYTEAQYHTNDDDLASSPASLSPTTPKDAAWRLNVDTSFPRRNDGPDRTSLESAFATPLLAHERMGNAFHVKTPSEEKAKALGLTPEALRLQVAKRNQNRHSPNIDRASALRSHAISDFSQEEASDSSSSRSQSLNRRSSRLLSLVLDMYTSDWKGEWGDDISFDDQPFADDYQAALNDPNAFETVVPASEQSRAAPKPLFWEHVASPNSPVKSSKASILSHFSPTSPDTISHAMTLPPPQKEIGIIPPTPPFKEVQQSAPVSIRHQFNVAHSAKSSVSSSNSRPVTPSNAPKDVPPHRIKDRDLSDYELLFPSFRKAISKIETGKRKDPRPQTPRPQTPRQDSPPIRSSPIRSSPIRSSPNRSSPSKAHAKFNFENMLGLRKAPSKEKPAAEFDYNKPIARQRADSNHDRKLRNALKEAKKEKAAGVKGAQEIFTAIQANGMPAEKENPFGIYNVPPPPAFAYAEGDAERGRTKALGFGIGMPGKQRSKSQKRREDLKKRIRHVGETDPNWPLVSGLGNIGAMSPAGEGSGTRDFAR